MADDFNVVTNLRIGFSRVYMDDKEPVMSIRMDLRAHHSSSPGGASALAEASLHLPVSLAERLGHRLLEAVPEAHRRAAQKDH